MKEAMSRYFDRLFRAYAEQGVGLPRAPFDPAVDPRIWQSPPDEEGYAAWGPLEKTVRHDIAALTPDLSPLHPSIDEYFNSWWFCSLDGGFGAYRMSLLPVMPSVELDSFLVQARRYERAHGGTLEHVPLGVELNGLQVLVDNRDGSVTVEDWERRTFQPLAENLEALIADMQP